MTLFIRNTDIMLILMFNPISTEMLLTQYPMTNIETNPNRLGMTKEIHVFILLNFNSCL